MMTKIRMTYTNELIIEFKIIPLSIPTRAIKNRYK